MNQAVSIIVVDDDDLFRDRLSRALTRRGYQTYQANGYDQAIPLITEHRPQLAIFDLKMPGKSGLMLVESAIAIDPELTIMVLTGYGSIATATEAIKLGAKFYLAKPADVSEILNALTGNSATNSKFDDELEPPSLARIEWEHIQRVLQDCDGNISTAARKLGLHRRTLQRKLNKLAPD